MSESDLSSYMAIHGVRGELVCPGPAMPTVSCAATALGVPEGQIVKSIVFQHKKDKARACLAVAPGGARVHPAKVARALGLTQLKLASAEVAKDATGYEVGGIPPVGHRTALPVVIDRSVLARDVVFGGGGDEQHMLKIAPAEIVRLTSATVADILTDPSEDALPAERAEAREGAA